MQVSTTTTADPLYMYNNMNKILLNPFVFIIILLVILGYILFFISLGNNSTTDDSSGKIYKIFGFIIIGILFLLVLVNAFQYFFSINVTAIFKNFMSEKPQIDLVIKEPPPNPHSLYSEIKEYRKEKKEQVFNIPGNYYNYENAKALCTAYGADLATYEQIENSYQNGGEWCNYGWSDGQMALFPTQQTTFNTLQDKPGHEHDCGRPGINGGYIANPNVRFGVNCYGTKPAITQEEETLMDTTPQYPESAEDIAFQKRVDFWKSNISNILISPFNQGNWNFTNN